MVASACALLIFVGNVTSGWPPSWELVPGTFHVDGFESGVDRPGIEAARWIGAHLPPGERVACDFTACSLLDGYGRQQSVNDAPALFFASAFGRSTRRLVRDRQIDFVVVDRRLSRQRPVTGSYFPRQLPQAGNEPIPGAALDKFDHVPGISRVYDNGPIVIYDLRGIDHA
jgi:hypothetical protein